MPPTTDQCLNRIRSHALCDETSAVGRIRRDATFEKRSSRRSGREQAGHVFVQGVVADACLGEGGRPRRGGQGRYPIEERARPLMPIEVLDHEPMRPESWRPV
jgi:hypothetical protein